MKPAEARRRGGVLPCRAYRAYCLDSVCIVWL